MMARELIFIFLCGLADAQSRSWIFARVTQSGSHQPMKRDYCVSHISSMIDGKTGDSIAFGSLTGILHEKTADFVAPRGNEWDIVRCGDSGASCAEAYESSSCRGVRGKAVLYEFLCTNQTQLFCFPCGQSLKLVQALEENGALAVILMPKYISFEFFSILNKTSKDQYFDVPGRKSLGIQVVEATEGSSDDGARFFLSDFEEDFSADFSFEPRITLWTLDVPLKANKILALPFLALIAIFICFFCAVAAADIAHRNIRQSTETKRSKKSGTKRGERKKPGGGVTNGCRGRCISETISAVILLVVVVGFLLLFYFCIDWIIPIMAVAYAFAAVFLVILFRPLIRLFPYGKTVIGCSSQKKRGERPCRRWCRDCCFIEIELREMVAGLLFLGVGVIWYVFRRNLLYVWPLHLMIGFGLFYAVLTAVALTMGEELRFRYIFAASIVLFFYDVFMVFITPLFTKAGESVMVAVAQGDSSGEVFPFVLLLPEFLTTMETSCRPRSYAALLGFGDVFIPTLFMFVTRLFALRIEDGLKLAEPDGGGGIHGPRKKVRPSTVYGIAFAMAYTLALALAMGMIFVFQTPQPALLYIVPFVNVAVISVAACRGELEKLWAADFSVESELRRGSETRRMELDKEGKRETEGGERRGGNFNDDNAAGGDEQAERQNGSEKDYGIKDFAAVALVDNGVKEGERENHGEKENEEERFDSYGSELPLLDTD